MKDLKFALILTTNSLAVTPYSICFTFVPPLAKEIGLDEAQIGFMLGSFAVGLFFTSTWAGSNMQYFDKKRMLTFSILILISGVLLFSILCLIASPIAFLVIGILARVVQGISTALIICILYSIIPKLYPDTMQKKIGLMEIGSGLGFGLGPLLGSILNDLLGFSAAFLTVAALLLLLIEAIKRIDIFEESCSPEAIANERLIGGPRERAEYPEGTTTVNYSLLFQRPRMVFTYMLLVVAFSTVSIDSPVFAIFLKEKYGLGPTGVALLISLKSFFYTLPSFFTDYILSRKYDRRLYLVVGFICQNSGLIFIAGSFFIGHHMGFLVLGTTLLGYGNFSTNLPGIPEFIDIIKEAVPHENADIINNYAPGIFYGIWGVSEFLGPILGGILTKNFELPRAIEIFSFIMWAMLGLYLTLGRGYEGLKASYESFLRGGDLEKSLLKGDIEMKERA